MKTLLSFLLCFLLAFGMGATTTYVAQTSLGSGDGSSTNNAKAIASFNTAGMSPDDTMNIFGTMKGFAFSSSGTPGHPITIHMEPNARLSDTNGQMMFIVNVSNVVIDGGSNGIMENTDTGTGLTYSNAATMINMSGSRDMVVKNVHLQNQYVHTNINDANPEIATGGGIYANGLDGSNHIFNCSFSDVGWCIEILTSTAQFLEVTNCCFTNYDHGVVPGGTNIIIANNHFDTAANWDTVANRYHHDPIHFFGSQNTASFIISGNVFTNDLGNNNTAMIYLETGPPNVLMFNNLFLQYPGNYLNNGMVYSGGDNARIFNNTFAGSGVNNSGGMTIAGAGNFVVNNLFTGFNTFIYQASGSATYSNNLYALVAPGGNAPFGTNGATYSTFAAWQAAVGDANSVYTNGAVVNSGGTLFAGSPAIGAGANLSSIFTTDFAGHNRGSSFGIGAYQFIPVTLFTSGGGQGVATVLFERGGGFKR